MTITERVAYIKGLAEGLALDDASKEAKVIKAMLEVLEDLAFSVTDIEDDMKVLSAQVDEIDEDLGTLEEEYYGEEDDDDLMDDDDLYEVECPKCGDTVYIDEEMLEEGSIDCPNCGELLEFDLDPEEEHCCDGEDGCDCDK